MTLTPADLALHVDRLRIPLEHLVAAQVHRVSDPDARELLGLHQRHGDLSGVVYPRIHPVTGHVVGYRLRRDHPEIEGGRPKNKYLSSIDRAHLYFPPGAGALLDDLTVSVLFVEAEKSALGITASAQRAGRRVLVVATGGCWSWKGRIGKTEDEHGARVDEHGPLPDLDLIALHKRDVVIMFDGDARINTKVAAARRAFAQELS